MEKIKNESIINVVGDWIYYSNRDDGYCIYKIRIDGTGREKLNSDNSAFINVVNSWIYYINDESQNGRFCDNQTSKLFDEWAMILNMGLSKTGKLYKMRTDGTGRTEISDVECSFVNVIDDWIYFSKSSMSSSLFGGLAKIHINGTGMTDIGKSGSCVNIANDWIYYYTSNTRTYNNSDPDFTKMRIDGTDSQLVE
jgi:hypothetical protein